MCVGFKRFSEDIALMLGKKPNLYFKITWMGVAPIVLGVSTLCQFIFIVLSSLRLSTMLL